MPILREFFDMYDAKVADLRAQRIPKNLGDSELRILAGVHEFGASGISAVALRSRVSQPYVSKVVKSLQRRGLVSSQKSPDDARLLLISLTAAGTKILERKQAIDAEVETEVLSRLSSLQRSLFETLITQMIEEK